MVLPSARGWLRSAAAQWQTFEAYGMPSQLCLRHERSPDRGVPAGEVKPRLARLLECARCAVEPKVPFDLCLTPLGITVGRDRESPLAVIDSPIPFPMIAQAEHAVSGVVTLAAGGARNEAAQVHALAIKVFGNRETCATTARDEEHPYWSVLLPVHFQFFPP
jgi:hypothetical protein